MEQTSHPKLFEGVIGAAIALIGITLLGILQIVGLGFQLPDTIPVHFDINGAPDGFANRDTHLWLHTGFLVINIAFVAFVCWVVPRIPDSLVNLPNKEYWLAPERREKTHARMKSMLLWIATATALLFICIFFLTWLVAMNVTQSISPWFWIVLLAYLTFVLGMCFLNFRLPAKNPYKSST